LDGNFLDVVLSIGTQHSKETFDKVREESEHVKIGDGVQRQNPGNESGLGIVVMNGSEESVNTLHENLFVEQSGIKLTLNHHRF
jgi:hypothetical protein